MMDNSDKNLYEMFKRLAGEHGDAPAFFVADKEISFNQFLADVEKLSAGLVNVGAVQGERVAILAQNSLEYLHLLAACARTGAILYALNWRLSPQEIGLALVHAEPKLFVVGADFAPALAGLDAPYNFTLAVMGEASLEEAITFDSLYTGEPVDLPMPGPEAPLAIIGTAATEGLPRGAVLTHANFLTINTIFGEMFKLSSDDRALAVLPLFHISGLNLVLQTAAAGGASVILPGFDPAAGARLIDELKVTQVGTFPPMLEMLLAAREELESSWDSLTHCSGILNPPEIIQKLLTDTKAQYWTGYGQTETTGVATWINAVEKPGSAGKAVPSLELRIVNELDEDMPAGEPGEIIVRGPLVFAGYWRDEEASEYAARGGWHHTGDLGKLDEDGHLYYVGRKPEKELIKSGGENVYPAEVEYVIRNLPEVADVCVIGVQSEKWGEAVKAVVELVPGSTLETEKLIEAVASKIASYKKPQFVDFVDELPRTPSGDIDRQAVKSTHS